MTIGERIKELRREESVVKFCSRFNIHKNTLPRYESGKTTPDGNFLAALCKEYQVHADWLLLGEGAKHRADKSTEVALLNMEALVDAIDTIEKTLHATQKTMKPEDKAEVIAKVYELFLDEDKGKSKEKIYNILKLVA